VAKAPLSNAAPAAVAPPPTVVPRFPLPPEQHEPWDGDPRLPAALVDAARTLFEQGFADPRGCEYREIELAVGSVWSGGAGTVRVHGFVIPGQPYAVAWNGLVYPVPKVGAKVDLAADVVGLLGNRTPKRRLHLASEEGDSVTLGIRVETVVLLARFGEGELADQMWRATGYDLKQAPDPYGVLATEWVWRIFDRALTAHMRGAHPLALESLQLLAAVQPLVEAVAAHRGFAGSEPGKPYLDFLEPVPALFADEQRRAARGVHAPLPGAAALAQLPEADRVATLIDHLDEVAARQWGQPGGVDLSRDPIVDALIQIGAPAVEPLIEVVASDQRLTRSVHFWRDFAHERSPLGVHEAACTALEAILETSFFEAASTGDDLSGRGPAGRAEVAGKIRAYWAKWKSVPIEERWYRVLADDQAKPEDWLEAAEKITRIDLRPSSMEGSGQVTKTVAVPWDMRGEPLRAHTAPSVTDLIEKRIASVDLDKACAFALVLFNWDRAVGRPALDEQLRRAMRASGTTQKHARVIQEITESRLDAGDFAIIDTYAAWVENVQPLHRADYPEVLILETMARSPLRPAVVKAAEHLFRDGSPWLPLLVNAKVDRRPLGELLEHNLIFVPAFNKHVVKMFADKRRVGEVEVGEEDNFSVSTIDGGGLSSSIIGAPPNVPPAGTKRVVRMADWYAWTIAHNHENAPRFELFWSDAQRDAALPAIVAWVRDQVARP